MTIAEVIEKLSQEREKNSRFPVRIIFIDSLSAYAELIRQLKVACEVIVNVADYCKGPDLAPQFDMMAKNLSVYKDKQVLVTSVGEYLRICVKRELDDQRGQFRAFWEQMQSQDSRTRYVLPMFCCRDVFERIIGMVDVRQEDFIWSLEKPSVVENYHVLVYSPSFRELVQSDAENFSEWLRNWDDILSRKTSCTLISALYKNVENSFGIVDIQAIDSPFQCLVDYLADGDKLVKVWQNDVFWSKLLSVVTGYNEKEINLATLILNELNANDFNFVSIAALWKTFNEFQKSLVWLWYRVYPTDEYYSYACKKAENANEIPERIRDEILKITNRSQKWLLERLAAVKAFAFTEYSDVYFALLDKIPVPETRLQLLTFQTHEERTYAIKVISSMLRDGAEPEGLSVFVEQDYPMLATYMTGTLGVDDVDEYMAWYRKNKLINRYSGEYSTEISLERFDARFKLLQKMRDEDCYTLWIDGFGIEWAPTFLYQVRLRGIVPDSTDIATSLLPTETMYNHQWNENDPFQEKWNRLDAVSHHGMPDDKSYYSCIAHQLAVFEDAAQKVDELLKEHEYVVVTGDHGSSRMAALAFHEESVVPIIPSRGMIVHSYGRFCELSDEASSDYLPLPGMERATNQGKTFLVMKGYQHFQIGGNAAGGNTDDQDIVGEIHGGNTLEERLVPVIVFKRSQPLPPLTCTPQSRFVSRKNGHVETILEFNRKIFSLEVSFNDSKAECVAVENGAWRVSLDGVTSEEIPLSIIANGCLIPENITLKVRTCGINKNADPFG